MKTFCFHIVDNRLGVDGWIKVVAPDAEEAEIALAAAEDSWLAEFFPTKYQAVWEQAENKAREFWEIPDYEDVDDDKLWEEVVSIYEWGNIMDIVLLAEDNKTWSEILY